MPNYRHLYFFWIVVKEGGFARGLGVFPLAELGAESLALLRGLRWLGRADGVIEEIHAIRSRRGQHHALASQVIAAAQS